MSIVAVACPKQMSFPWMQVEVAHAPVNKSSQRRRTAQSVKPTVKPSVEKIDCVSQPAAPVVGNPATRPLAAQPAALTVSKDQAASIGQVVVLDRNQRVGEVRIGKVMMQLLKRYGITDEEISSVLATIAQEKCENLAS